MTVDVGDAVLLGDARQGAFGAVTSVSPQGVAHVVFQSGLWLDCDLTFATSARDNLDAVLAAYNKDLS